MIVVRVSDPYLRRAVLRAARPEEDVVADARLAASALERGFPRLVVRDASHHRWGVPEGVRVVDVDASMLERWETERRAKELPPTRLDHLTDRMSALIQGASADRTWVDSALADLARAAGCRMPLPLRSFARRVLEFPHHYTSLRPLADACGITDGALKARFRRRDLASPSTYLRWFRGIAVSEVLSDRSVTVAEAASRLGFTSNGNLCRMMLSVTGMTPTDARSLRGWNRILVTFAWSHLSRDAVEAWGTLDELFERRIA